MPIDTHHKAAWKWKGRITRLRQNHFAVSASIFETPAASSIRHLLEVCPRACLLTQKAQHGVIDEGRFLTVHRKQGTKALLVVPLLTANLNSLQFEFISVTFYPVFYPIKICIKERVVFSLFDPSVTIGEMWSWEQDLKEWSAVTILVELCSKVSLQIFQGDLIRYFNWNENIHLGILPISELMGRAKKWPIKANQTVSVSECALELGLTSSTDACLLCDPQANQSLFLCLSFLICIVGKVHISLDFWRAR